MTVHSDELERAWVARLRARAGEIPQSGVLEIAVEGAAPWHLILSTGEVREMSGPAPAPTMIVKASAQSWRALLQGHLSLTQATIDGRVRVSGDLIAGTALLRIAFL